MKSKSELSKFNYSRPTNTNLFLQSHQELQDRVLHQARRQLNSPKYENSRFSSIIKLPYSPCLQTEAIVEAPPPPAPAPPPPAPALPPPPAPVSPLPATTPKKKTTTKKRKQSSNSAETDESDSTSATEPADTIGAAAAAAAGPSFSASLLESISMRRSSLKKVEAPKDKGKKKDDFAAALEKRFMAMNLDDVEELDDWDDDGKGSEFNWENDAEWNDEGVLHI